MRTLEKIKFIAAQSEVAPIFERAKVFMETEGWLPASKSAYSVCCAIEEAIRCKESGEKTVTAFNISGHGFLDIFGYRTVLGLE